MSKRHKDDGSAPGRLVWLYSAIKNACPTGKIKIKKRAQAQSEAAHLNKQRPLQGPPIATVAYKCTVCGWWHVGRPNKSWAKMAKRRKRGRDQVARFLQDVHCEPDVAADVIEGTRALYAALHRIRRSGLPPEALSVVGEIEGLTIAFGQWLRDNGLGPSVFGDNK